MTNNTYMKQARDCALAAEKIRDPAERAALLKVAACYIMLADYVAERQKQGTARRMEDQPDMSLDS